uniref:C2 domain-containing protein n=1 Tax=Globodera pallida TaxID=36090 RepID=A0A183BNN3_GLOPA
MAPHLDFVTVTVKSVRGMPKEKAPSIHLRLFDGSLLLEERVPSRKNGDLSSRHGAPAPTTKTNSRDGAGADETATADGIQIGASFLLRVPPSAPLRLPFCHIVLSLYAVSFDGEEEQPQQLLGSCQLGPSGSASSGHIQWRQMIKKLGVPIAAWHELVGRPAAAGAAVDDGCGGGGLPPSPADDHRNNTVPRRRTTVSVPPLTVEMMRTLVAARQQSPPRICMETKKHAASTAAASSSSRQQIGTEMGTKNEC